MKPEYIYIAVFVLIIIAAINDKFLSFIGKPFLAIIKVVDKKYLAAKDVSENDNATTKEKLKSKMVVYSFLSVIILFFAALIVFAVLKKLYKSGVI